MKRPRVAFVLDDSKLVGVDLREPSIGNPGVGGTHYCFSALASELAQRRIADIVLFHWGASNLYPPNVSAIHVGSAPEALKSAFRTAGPFDWVVLRGDDRLCEKGTVDLLPTGTPVVAWVHNHLRPRTLAFFDRSERIKRVVYVGREQWALALGSPCAQKSTYIVNGFYPVNRPSADTLRERRAVYIGSLVPSKGFHRLARLWPLIHRACPDAALDVIGSGQLYDHKSRLGVHNLAEPRYERLFMRHLSNDPRKYNVVFHGKLGAAKFDLMQRATLGLPNPTAFTECCPGSVLELASSGLAVVAPRRWGMCDTVADGETGYLCSSEKEYVSRAVSLLRDPEAAARLGQSGRQFVAEHFGFAAVCDRWRHLLCEGGMPQHDARDRDLRGRYPSGVLRRLSSHLRVASLQYLIDAVERSHGAVLRWF